MTPEEFARHAKAAVVAVGAAFGHDPSFEARATQLGLTRWQYYFAGRCGVLGAVDAAVVVAACGFFAPRLVAGAWDAARRTVPLAVATQSDVDQCVAWSRAHLADLAGLDLLADLLGRAVTDADDAARPLFAAWRALPDPAEDAVTRVALSLLRLREHRGASHLIAVSAAGLTPLQAILAGPGRRKAAANGWEPPYPELAHDGRDRLAKAEEITDRLAAQPFADLAPAELDDAARLLDAVYSRWQRLR